MLLWLLLFEALASCAVGPDYRKPKQSAPEHYQFDQPSGEAGVPGGDWWTVFNDRRLDQLVDRVLSSNQDLAVALARFDETRGLLGVTKADEYPSLLLAPSYARARTSADVGNPFPHLNTTLYSVPASVAYEVDLWGRVRRSVASAQAQLEASRDAVDSLRISLAAEAASEFLQVRSYDSEIDVLERTVVLRQQSLDLVAGRFHAGVVNALDVARARTDLETTKAELEDTRRRRELVAHGLAVLSDQNAPDYALTPEPLISPVPDISAGLPGELLQRRPDVAQSERLLAAANERIGVARAAYFPRVVLTASGGVASRDLSDLFESPSLLWSIGPNIAFPVFDGGRNRGNLRAAQARYREALASYQKTVLVAFREVQDALSDTAFLKRRQSDLEAALSAARESSQVSRSRYDRGLVSYLEVVDSERTELSTERDAIQNRQQQFVATISLIKALGGGWSPQDLASSGEGQ